MELASNREVCAREVDSDAKLRHQAEISVSRPRGNYLGYPTG